MRLGHIRRPGTTLIETMVAMFLISVVMGMAISIMNAMFRLEDRVKTHGEVRASTARLARAFRSDVRHATAIDEAPADGSAFGLTLASGETVVYRVERGSPERIETRPDGRRLADRFLCPARGLVLERSSDGHQLRLRFDRRSPGGTPSGPRPIDVTATLGADLRFQKQETTP